MQMMFKIIHPLNNDDYPITLNGNEMQITLTQGNCATTVIRYYAMVAGNAL